MKILYIHQYFTLPEQGGAIRSYHLAKSLAEKGHEVELITAYNKKEYTSVSVEGFTVHYLPVFYDNRYGFFKRISAFVKFSFSAFFLAKKIKGDVCFATSTPLTVALVPLLLKLFHRTPFYFEVRDLWPEAPVQMGFIKNFFLKKALYVFEKVVYKKAEKIIALSPGIKNYIERKAGAKPVHLIPNMSDCDFFQKENKRAELINKFEVQGRFVVSFFGAVGKANHLEHLLDIAKYCQDQKEERLLFFIIGKGSEYERIQKEAKDKRLSSIRFFGFRDKSALKELLNITDAAYTSFVKFPIMETNSPNKFFDALAAGKLSIVNTEGWLKTLVEENKCGFYANPLQPELFFKQIVPFIQQPDMLQQYQGNARALAERQFDKKLLSEKFTKLFEPA